MSSQSQLFVFHGFCNRECEFGEDVEGHRNCADTIHELSHSEYEGLLDSTGLYFWDTPNPRFPRSKQ